MRVTLAAFPWPPNTVIYYYVFLHGAERAHDVASYSPRPRARLDLPVAYRLLALDAIELLCGRPVHDPHNVAEHPRLLKPLEHFHYEAQLA